MLRRRKKHQQHLASISWLISWIQDLACTLKDVCEWFSLIIFCTHAFFYINMRNLWVVVYMLLSPLSSIITTAEDPLVFLDPYPNVFMQLKGIQFIVLYMIVMRRTYTSPWMTVGLSRISLWLKSITSMPSQLMTSCSAQQNRWMTTNSHQCSKQWKMT